MRCAGAGVGGLQLEHAAKQHHGKAYNVEVATPDGGDQFPACRLDSVSPRLVHRVTALDVGVDVGLVQFSEGHMADLRFNPGWGGGVRDGHSADYPVRDTGERAKHLAGLCFTGRLAQDAFPGATDNGNHGVAADDKRIFIRVTVFKNPLGFHPGQLAADEVGRSADGGLIDPLRCLYPVGDVQLIKQLTSSRGAGGENQVHRGILFLGSSRRVVSAANYAAASPGEKELVAAGFCAVSGQDDVGGFGPGGLALWKAVFGLITQELVGLLPAFRGLEKFVRRSEFLQALFSYGATLRGKRFRGVGLGQ